MTGHPKQFVIYRDGAGDYRWSLYSVNSKLIADSGEGYKNRADCLHGMKLVAAVATNAPVYDRDKQQWLD